jgi:hypothetical protein
MRGTVRIGVGLGIVLSALASAVSAQELPQQPEKQRRWSVAFRIGGFSDSSSEGWYGPHAKYWRQDVGPEVTSGLDISRLLGPRSGLTLSFDGMVFAGNTVIIAPMSLTYRYFPIGTGISTEPGAKRPAVQPWLGVGGGVYAFIVDDEHVVSSHPGGHLSSGLLVPLSRRFDVLGELRYAAASDARFLSYTMGLAVRF